ncbi:hypothetical protein ABTZ03_44140 [Kitasatospora sp. NPDC096077]|uniref:hypothetical protein n=1 Tax=Kitasatospora sp. NPDC096077 TaxID=3155544 RepID=UPI0033326498
MITGAGTAGAAPRQDTVAAPMSEGGHHAREWITDMACMHFLDDEVTARGRGPVEDGTPCACAADPDGPV